MARGQGGITRRDSVWATQCAVRRCCLNPRLCPTAHAGVVGVAVVPVRRAAAALRAGTIPAGWRIAASLLLMRVVVRVRRFVILLLLLPKLLLFPKLPLLLPELELSLMLRRCRRLLFDAFGMRVMALRRPVERMRATHRRLAASGVPRRRHLDRPRQLRRGHARCAR